MMEFTFEIRVLRKFYYVNVPKKHLSPSSFGPNQIGLGQNGDR